MIYCNKRKKHIKPEVGQVWETDTGCNMEIVHFREYYNNNSGGYLSALSYSWPYHYHSFYEDGQILRDDNVKVKLTELIQEAPKHKSQWQPIDTAPEDGGTVLLYDDTVNMVFMGSWCPIGGLWMHDMIVDIGSAGLTHWMPLPDVPEGK